MSSISIRVDSKDKNMFEDFCNSMGMNVSTAVNMFIKNVIMHQKLPFAIERDSFYSKENRKGVYTIVHKTTLLSLSIILLIICCLFTFFTEHFTILSICRSTSFILTLTLIVTGRQRRKVFSKFENVFGHNKRPL